MEEDASPGNWQELQRGTPMTKVSSKKHKPVVLRLDPDLGQVIWESKQNHIIPIENVKELRSGTDTRYYREQFQLAQEYEDRWITIVYIMNGAYKTLHVIAATKDVFNMWNTALRKLHTIRRELMSGLGNTETRQAIWEKQCWKGADEDREQKLGFEDVEKLCRRLNIHSNTEDLLRLFKQADRRQRGYLDFDDFRHFVKLLKARPEIDRLFHKLSGRGGGVFDFSVFEKFMREKQESRLSHEEMQSIFERYSESIDGGPSSLRRIMNLEMFASFLLSPENSAFTDQHGKVWHDMTRPLPDYYVSSSHNTYLVGHQLVGVSTIEGYIRALLHSCRSVELDIYDNVPITEPMIFHGKTFTSKVPLRDVCRAIAKYGFVASPYPIIISAEMHCSVAGQEVVVAILKAIFGQILVDAPISGERGKAERLPSPEQFKGRILFKTKNLDLERREFIGDAEDKYSSTETSSTSDSDAAFEQQRQGGSAKRVMESDAAKDFKGGLLGAGSTVFQHVRSVGKLAPSPSLPANGTKRQHLLPKLRTDSLSDGIPPGSSSTGSGYSSPTHSQAIYVNQVFSASPPSSSSSFVPTPQRSPPEYPSSTPRRSVSDPETGKRPAPPPSPSTKSKQKMAPSLLELLVYTVGVKCKGINKKEMYKPEYMFSLSETTANRMIKAVSSMPALVSSFGNGRPAMSSPPRGGNTGVSGGGGSGMQDLIKHCRTHLVRVYPKATRVSSTNFEPHRYWSAGVQLVAINWQTFDLGYMINHAMFQRNGRAGYVLKPAALRGPNPANPNEIHMTKDLLARRTTHYLDVSIISAQQLPRPKDSSGREIVDKTIVVHPFVEVSIHVPDWTTTTASNNNNTPSMRTAPSRPGSPPGPVIVAGTGTATPSRTISHRTGVVKNNGFNPVWEEKLRIPFDCVGDMRDLVFVRFLVRQAGRKDDEEPLAVYCASLGSLGMGYRHLPLHDMQLSQYLFSTLFVRMAIVDA